MNEYIFNTNDAGIQVKISALDEEMALAYKSDYPMLAEIAQRDKSKKLRKITENECGAEMFIVKDPVKITKFIDDHIGIDYEVDEDTVTLFEMTVSERAMLRAFITSRGLWAE